MPSVEKRVKPDGIKWYARYRDGSGRQRSKTFPRKMDAERFITTIAADLLRGQYIDPDAGKVTFETYAAKWLAAQTFEQSTREAVAARLRTHAFPTLGAMPLRAVRPSTIQSWLRTLENLAPSYQRVILTNVATVFSAAVDDELLAKNPCSAGSVRSAKVEARRITPWTSEQTLSVRECLPTRYRAVVTLGAGLGLRQGEIFGLSTDDIDLARNVVHVRRQVKMLGNGAQIFAPPKNTTTRDVPLSSAVRDDLEAFLDLHPAITVALPWRTPDGPVQSWPLIVSTRERTPVGRHYFNARIWKPALIAAGLTPTRDNGCHAMRHFFASVLLDGGESIKAVSSYLGHSDPGFTLRTYTHLMPASAERCKRAIDAAFRVPDVDQPHTTAQNPPHS